MKFEPKSYKAEFRVVYMFGSYRNDMIAFIILAAAIVGLIAVAIALQ